ncbi:hypothetical protein, variant [Saprolegnia diclina VS20]|uniref:F-box domain-containing protein n=1 Tax=Saprolegnia diclina (strain VS20) TaxID=1156394 RepID=T0QBH2_SAPDV|nr:hypothetical protein, variant [Saprolegnia diclina VS20]EQC35259.1 hypothetical protein, variant [Saprolegnia diclina VS20]|eukprot:XP_008611543.1 hypothetical protein, variant [Saprolegnia diclina VS20]
MRPVLSEELEKLVLAMVHPLPDLVRWQLVCKRWRRLLTDPMWLPATVLDMDVLRPLSAAQYAALLERWRGTTVLQMTLEATIPHEQQWQMDIGRHLDRLCELRLRTTSTKAVLAILMHCRQLHTLELLECRSLVLPKLPEPVALAVLQMHTATPLKSATLANFLRKCPELKSLTITAGPAISSSMLTTLVQGCTKMERLIFNQCGAVAAPDVAAFLTAFGHQLVWLDLSHSRAIVGLNINLRSPLTLSCLEGLVLDGLRIRDDFLRYLECPVLGVLSLQVRRLYIQVVKCDRVELSGPFGRGNPRLHCRRSSAHLAGHRSQEHQHFRDDRDDD